MAKAAWTFACKSGKRRYKTAEDARLAMLKSRSHGMQQTRPKSRARSLYRRKKP